MNTAEKLRTELLQSAPFKKEEFLNSIVGQIRLSGYARFYCNFNTNKTELDSYCPTIRNIDEPIAVEYARSEGFNVSYGHNSYGVRYIVFTL